MNEQNEALLKVVAALIHLVRAVRTTAHLLPEDARAEQFSATGEALDKIGEILQILDEEGRADDRPG